MDSKLFGDKFLRAVWAGEPCSQSVADAMKGIDTTDIDIVFFEPGGNKEFNKYITPFLELYENGCPWLKGFSWIHHAMLKCIPADDELVDLVRASDTPVIHDKIRRLYFTRAFPDVE